MIHHYNVPTNIRYRVYKEAHRNATMINGLIVIDIFGNQATRYEHSCRRNLFFATKIRIWGEAGVVNTRIWSTPKISDRATVCMMGGYNHNSGADLYRMWYPGNNRVRYTRGIHLVK